MQYAASAATRLTVELESRGTAPLRAAKFLGEILAAGSGFVNPRSSFNDVVVRRTEDGAELLRRHVKQSAEFIAGEMRADLRRHDVDGFIAKWSESEFFVTDE